MCNLCYTYRTHYPNYNYCPVCGDKIKDISLPRTAHKKVKPNIVKRQPNKGDRVR